MCNRSDYYIYKEHKKRHHVVCSLYWLVNAVNSHIFTNLAEMKVKTSFDTFFIFFYNSYKYLSGLKT